MNREVSFEILEHKKVLRTSDNGWTKEANIVTWNEGVPKLDIREWDPTHERMSRGITLVSEDAVKLIDILKEKLPVKNDFPTEGYECEDSPGESSPHPRMSRGICLTWEEASSLSEVKVSDPFFPKGEGIIADEVIDRIVNYFLENPEATLTKTAYGEVKVDFNDGAYTLPMSFRGYPVEVTVKEVG